MNRFTLRTRVTTAFLLAILLAAVLTALVVSVQRESRAAFDEEARTGAILTQHARLVTALTTTQAALRGFVITGMPEELSAYDSHQDTYQRLLAQIASIVRDPGQRGRLTRIRTLAEEWERRASDVIALRSSGKDVGVLVAGQTAPQFRALRSELDAFEARQRALNDAAVQRRREQVEYATIMLTAAPVAAMLWVLLQFAATHRLILRPLAALADFARRLAAGDRDAPLPPGRNDEIGEVIEAFGEMRSAVQARTADLERAHGELMTVINTAPAGLVVLNADGSIRLQNKAALHLLGNPPEDVEGRKAHWERMRTRTVTGREVPLERLPAYRALSGVEILGEEVAIDRPDGEHAELLIAAAPIRDTRGVVTGAIAGFQDITRLRELDRLKDEFVAVVSHELRTPLTAIRGSLQLLLADDAVADAEHRELLTVASTSCERLVRIVNDMLDLSKIEAGRLDLRLAPLSVETLVHQAMDAIRPIADQAGVTLDVAITDVLPAVRADADRLTQALVNLLSNAMKFAPRGSTVQMGAEAWHGDVVISISDQGPGIAPDQLPRLFQKFRQLDSAGTRRTGGTGLGLVITKALIEQHGGTIAVDSVVGRGTTFIVTLPTRDVDAPERQAAAVAGGAEYRPSVLLVGTNMGSSEGLAPGLKAAGFDVRHIAPGPGALDLARRELPHAIVLAAGTEDVAARRFAKSVALDDVVREIPLIVTLDELHMPRTPDATEPYATGIANRIERLRRGRGQATVLVAEDDEDARLVLRSVLERSGFCVVEAADGAEALDVAARTPLDAVLLDLRMPRVHGHDVIRTLRRNHATTDVPIIVLSGSHSERHSLYALVLGANAFLAKPAEPQALVREIMQILGRERVR
jgi:PAS domain S-box-containing protein